MHYVFWSIDKSVLTLGLFIWMLSVNINADIPISLGKVNGEGVAWRLKYWRNCADYNWHNLTWLTTCDTNLKTTCFKLLITYWLKYRKPEIVVVYSNVYNITWSKFVVLLSNYFHIANYIQMLFTEYSVKIRFLMFNLCSIFLDLDYI